MITLNLPNQKLQGILYKQALLPNQASQLTRVTMPLMGGVTAGGGGGGGAPPIRGVLKAEEALSQELDSRHDHPGSSSKRPRPGGPPTMAMSPPRLPRTPYQFFQLGVNKDQVRETSPLLPMSHNPIMLWLRQHLSFLLI